MTPLPAVDRQPRRKVSPGAPGTKKSPGSATNPGLSESARASRRGPRQAYLMTRNSTRRLAARPSSVALSATGMVRP
jgi:hypothetical protein